MFIKWRWHNESPVREGRLGQEAARSLRTPHETLLQTLVVKTSQTQSDSFTQVCQYVSRFSGVCSKFAFLCATLPRRLHAVAPWRAWERLPRCLPETGEGDRRRNERTEQHHAFLHCFFPAWSRGSAAVKRNRACDRISALERTCVIKSCLCSCCVSVLTEEAESKGKIKSLVKFGCCDQNGGVFTCMRLPGSPINAHLSWTTLRPCSDTVIIRPETWDHERTAPGSSDIIIKCVLNPSPVSEALGGSRISFYSLSESLCISVINKVDAKLFVQLSFCLHVNLCLPWLKQI